eukprot:7263114-Pyramimonas_sp.AAC.1
MNLHKPSNGGTARSPAKLHEPLFTEFLGCCWDWGPRCTDIKDGDFNKEWGSTACVTYAPWPEGG